MTNSIILSLAIASFMLPTTYSAAVAPSIKQVALIHFRWVPTLSSEDVADRIILSILRREKSVVMPSYLQFMLAVMW